jgi:hypothetical protein
LPTFNVCQRPKVFAIVKKDVEDPNAQKIRALTEECSEVGCSFGVACGQLRIENYRFDVKLGDGVCHRGIARREVVAGL